MGREVTAGVLNAGALSCVLAANLVFGRHIKKVSDAAVTILTPPPLAFTIWAVLYSLLVVTCAAQFYDPLIVKALSGWFILSCAGTIAWLVLYTRQRLIAAAVSLCLTTVCIGLCYARVQTWRAIAHVGWPRVVATVTFSLYFGWTLLAACLNLLQTTPPKWAAALGRIAYVLAYATVTAVGFALRDPLIGLPLGWATVLRGLIRCDPLAGAFGALTIVTSGTIALYNALA